MTRKTEFLGLNFDVLGMEEVLAKVSEVEAGQPFRYTVTPNVDHVVRLETADARVRQTYADAELVLCDSRVLACLARLADCRLPVVPGSDLTFKVLTRLVRPGDRLCVIGSSPDQLATLAEMMPQVELVQHVPPMGLRTKPDAMRAAVDFAAEKRARFTFLAVGSPQQELLAHAMLESGRCGGMAFCIGASIDFLTGRQRRAPRWMRRMGIEWLHRLASDPARMWRRYTLNGIRIVPIVNAWRVDRNVR